MGLGKTLQIIAILVSLSLLPANARVEMPQHLKKDDRRYLIVCPSGIVENWSNEFKRWQPRNTYDALGTIYCIIGSAPLNQRLGKIRMWYRDGGVMISIYPLLIQC